MFSAIVAAITTILPQIVSFITTTAPKILPWLVNATKTFISVVKSNLPVIMDVIDSVTDVLDIFDRNKINSEEIGKRAMSSDKGMEDFENAEEYINYLQKEVIVEDKEYSDIESTAHKAVGSCISIKAIEEKVNLGISPEFWLDVAKNKLNPIEIVAILRKYGSEGVSLDFSDFCKGDLGFKEKKDRSEMLMDTFKELYPEKNSSDIENIIMKFKEPSKDGKDIEAYEL
ncbi:MAG: hypothetical protein B6229_04540 [Spirochaetaceae bacterium 4572_7]|nr:MAG: hypothetical protein B6229_04540 [Spirochaetaceae bacterium 4572_7]